MFVIREPKVLFFIYTGLALVFLFLNAVNSHRVNMAEALLQPLGKIEIVQGEITDVRKKEYMALIIPVTKQYVDYSYNLGGRSYEKSFRCRNMSACYWLETGSAKIMATQDGRYALPLELRDSLQLYKKSFTRRRAMEAIMAAVMALMALVSALSAGILRLPIRL